jgi:hypothetical protein
VTGPTGTSGQRGQQARQHGEQCSSAALLFAAVQQQAGPLLSATGGSIDKSAERSTTAHVTASQVADSSHGGSGRLRQLPRLDFL